jgi:hypothetical protein
MVRVGHTVGVRHHAAGVITRRAVSHGRAPGTG